MSDDNKVEYIVTKDGLITRITQKTTGNPVITIPPGFEVIWERNNGNR